MLIPSTAPSSRGMSVATMLDSSTTMGQRGAGADEGKFVIVRRRERLLDELHAVLGAHRDSLHRFPRRPCGVGVHAQDLVGSRAPYGPQPGLVVPAPKFDLEDRPRLGGARLLRHDLGSSIPIVNELRGAAPGSRPQSFHSGSPIRFPTQSWSADESAQRADPLRPSSAARSRSMSSSANGSSTASMRGVSFRSAASTVPTVSP